MPATPPELLDLTPGAAQFLDLLVELGHLDERMLALVNDRLLDLQGQAGAVAAVDVPDVKRVAAVVIDEHLGDTDREYQRAMKKEWPLLFH